MNSEVPAHIQPQRRAHEIWSSVEAGLAGERSPFQSTREIFLFIASGADSFCSADLQALDGKNMKEIESEVKRCRYSYVPGKSHARIFFIDDNKNLVCAETGSGVNAITFTTVTKVEKRPRDLFSPLASQYLEVRPDAVSEAAPAVNSDEVTGTLRSRLLKGMKELLSWR